MPKQNRSIEGLIWGHCKIRKRGCSSSSSSSSILQTYRFKRANLVGMKGGSSTPFPTWKMNSRSPSSIVGVVESSKYPPPQNGAKGKQVPVSARKLAATLWEMNQIPSPKMKENLDEKRSKKDLRGRERFNRSVHSGSLPPHLSDPSHSPFSERMDRSGASSYRRRSSAVSHRLRYADHNIGALDSISNASLMEVETQSRGLTPTGSIARVKTRLKVVHNGLTTSKELLKILNRIWVNEEQHSSRMSLVSALGSELERARVQVNQLIQEQKSDNNETNYLMKRFAEEKAAWKNKEQERIRAAIETIAANLEVEKKLRKRAESLNKKIGRELVEMKASFSKVVKELENEKRAREIIEQVCDELAKDMGEDKAEVEELKRESEKVREEVEKEREMLQLADVLREERVQMKLSEAKYQFEEKNAVVEKLRSELEAYLRNKSDNENGSVSMNHGSNEDLRNFLSKAHMISYQNEEKEEDERQVEDREKHEKEEEEDDDDDSGESDLHSIELNLDNNSRSYKWIYANGDEQEDLRRVSVEEDIKRRKSISEKIPRGNAFLKKGNSNGIERDFFPEDFRNSGDGFDWVRFFELEKQVRGGDYENETEKDKSMKGLRGFASPTRQWDQPWPSKDTENVVREKLPAIQGSDMKARLNEARGEGKNLRHSRQ